MEYTTPDEFARIIRMERWAVFLQGLDGYISQAWAPSLRIPERRPIANCLPGAMCLRFDGLKCHADCLWNAERVEGAVATQCQAPVATSQLREP